MGCGEIPSGIPGLGSYNFSFNEIVTTITIKLHQQMIVADQLTIDAGEELRIEGQLVLIK
jgi:hypothetical protein